MRFGLKVRTATTPEGILPPARTASSAVVTIDEAMGIPATFRAMQVLATAASQLTIDVERAGARIADTPSLIRKPCLDLTRAEWVEEGILSLAGHGNAFMRKQRVNGEVVNLPWLPPQECHVDRDEHGRKRVHHEGKVYYSDEVTHIGLLKMPGQLRALGPIQAARAGLTLNRDLREHMRRWFDDTGEANGILTSDQQLTPQDARAARRLWNDLDPETAARLDQTDNPKRIKVLGKGLKYESTLLSPEDALWLEAQNWNLRETAVVFGMPTTLMLVGYDGASKTYENSTAEWLAFVRFTLMWYLGKLEDALSDVLVRGQDARFRVESLLRADTKGRYESYKLAIDAGWMTPPEVRVFEKLGAHAAIPDEPRPAASLAPAPTTQKDPSNA